MNNKPPHYGQCSGWVWLIYLQGCVLYGPVLSQWPVKDIHRRNICHHLITQPWQASKQSLVLHSVDTAPKRVSPAQLYWQINHYYSWRSGQKKLSFYVLKSMGRAQFTWQRFQWKSCREWNRCQPAQCGPKAGNGEIVFIGNNYEGSATSFHFCVAYGSSRRIIQFNHLPDLTVTSASEATRSSGNVIIIFAVKMSDVWWRERGAAQSIQKSTNNSRRFSGEKTVKVSCKIYLCSQSDRLGRWSQICISPDTCKRIVNSINLKMWKRFVYRHNELFNCLSLCCWFKIT